LIGRSFAVCRYLVLDHFKRPDQVIEEHSTVAAVLATWAVNVVAYYDIIQTVEPKRQVLRKFILQYEAAQKRYGPKHADIFCACRVPSLSCRFFANGCVPVLNI